MPSALSSAFTVISLSTRQSSLKSFFALIFGRASLRVGSAKQATITKFVVLDWSQASLLNLVIRRMISNPPLVRALNIEREKVLSDFNAQRDLFYRVFPAQVDQGSKKPPTLDWMISRCADGTKKTAPRELIHLLTSLREKEISRLERGEPLAPSEQLFDRSVFKEALSIVSETRYQQNLIAEYPDLRDALAKLNARKQSRPSTVSQNFGK
jgi:hypothetical protein